MKQQAVATELALKLVFRSASLFLCPSRSLRTESSCMRLLHDSGPGTYCIGAFWMGPWGRSRGEDHENKHCSANLRKEPDPADW